MLLALPAHARTFKLADPRRTGVHVPTTTNAGLSGPFSGQAGFLTRLELLEFFAGNVMAFGFQDGTPFASSGSVWISYEDTTSVAAKTRFTVEQGIGVAIQLVSKDTLDASTSLTIACRQALMATNGKGNDKGIVNDIENCTVIGGVKGIDNGVVKGIAKDDEVTFGALNDITNESIEGIANGAENDTAMKMLSGNPSESSSQSSSISPSLSPSGGPISSESPSGSPNGKVNANVKVCPLLSLLGICI